MLEACSLTGHGWLAALLIGLFDTRLLRLHRILADESPGLVAAWPVETMQGSLRHTLDTGAKQLAVTATNWLGDVRLVESGASVAFGLFGCACAENGRFSAQRSGSLPVRLCIFYRC